MGKGTREEKQVWRGDNGVDPGHTDSASPVVCVNVIAELGEVLAWVSGAHRGNSPWEGGDVFRRVHKASWQCRPV